jgi:hypothetical protein
MDTRNKDVIILLLREYLHPIDAIKLMRTCWKFYNVIPIEEIHIRVIKYYSRNHYTGCDTFTKILIAENPDLKHECEFCEKIIIKTTHRCNYKKYCCLPISPNYKSLCKDKLYPIQRRRDIHHICYHQCLYCKKIVDSNYKFPECALTFVANNKEYLKKCICNIDVDPNYLKVEFKSNF